MNRLIVDMGFWYEGHTLSYPLIFSDCTVTYSIWELKVLLEYYEKDSWWKNYTNIGGFTTSLILAVFFMANAILLIRASTKKVKKDGVTIDDYNKK